MQLRCEDGTSPLGVDAAQPRLGWIIDSDERGAAQSAYRILVAASPEALARGEGDLWDSGEVKSDETQGIPYAGRALQSAQQVFWKVCVWPGAAWSRPATWTMGVVATSDWRAAWIGGTAGRTARGYHAAEADRADDVKWVQVDLGRPVRIDAVRLAPMQHEGKDGFGFPVRFKIEAADEAAFAAPVAVADQTGADFANPGTQTVSFASAGVTARFVRVTATALGKFTRMHCFALKQLEVMSGGQNVARHAPVAARDSVETWGWGKAALTDGLPGEGPRAASLVLRRAFAVAPDLKRALVNVCGLGTYELSLNGRKVGADLFPSGWTDYRKTLLYDTHDVTALLQAATNELRLLLGNGMYNVPGGRYTKFTGSFGAPKALAQLRLEYADGRVEWIATDESWQLSPGPLTFSCVYGGDDFDARWQPQWQPAPRVEGPGGTLRGYSSAAPPIRAFDVLKPVAQRALRPGVTVYDLGQNASLMPRIRVEGPAGATVRIVPSELVRDSGELEDNMCGGKAYWQYTCDGGPAREWFPNFFYRGARHLQVECAGGAAVAALEGVVVHSASEPVGRFECANPLFNRIHTLVRWAQRSNMMSVMTDCPHREKLGWLEQYHLNGPSLRYEFDLARLFAKGMQDMADAQLSSGLVPSIAPEYVHFGGETRNDFGDSPEWGSALPLVAWQQYLFTGDREPLRRHYDAMARYVAYLGRRAQGHIVSHGLGDWYDIGPKHPGYAQLTPKALTATAIYYEDLRVLARAARLLGKDAEARQHEALAAEVRAAFNAAFFHAELGSYATGSQCANAMPLVAGLVEPAQRAAVLAALVRDVQEKGLTAGDVGYRYLLRALADGGRSDVIYALNNQSAKPGYGLQLARGATSLTEAWDAARGPSNNHFMLGQIMEWFYHDLAGIQPDPEQPGFRHIVIRPAVVGDLAWARAEYQSPRGLIRSGWARQGAQLELNVRIPANTTATVWVPARDAGAVREGGKPAAQVPGLRLLRSESGCALWSVPAGSFQFTSEI